MGYGFFSLAVSVTSFVSILLFGPLQFSAVSQFAKETAAGRKEEYEASYIGLALLLALAAVLIGLILTMFGLIGTAHIFAAISFGLYSVLIELLRARLKIWTYGIVSLLQSILYLGLVFAFVGQKASHIIALNSYSASYGIAALICLFLIGVPKLRMFRISSLHDSLKIGGGYIVSNMAEQLLYLGTRYIVLLFGTPHLLGVFSFCVDLAQRTVGFLINAASFVFVPLAFHQLAAGESGQFGKTLKKGAYTSFGLSILAFIAILIAQRSGVLPFLNNDLFDEITFAIVSMAVVLNRLKKLTVDPFAMRANMPAALAIGYIIGAPPALILTAIAYRAELPYWGALGYASGYLVAIWLTVLYLKKKQILMVSRRSLGWRNPSDTGKSRPSDGTKNS
ncbi:hypothetical protein ATM17_23025 [Sphingopyxis macrogoltabida]|uniref:Polysaccharide biosynthesis protein C-terminal domain-containing protein n=1 Tax=Sphingopyxis macrogoltabida TaxID=33050 RepID=A0AAC9FGT2_SPHMC|nr:hypothetical protein ATM17_23025 [Sphingopyxis macrogoltabida]